MRLILLPIVIVLLFACKKNKVQEPLCKFITVNRAGSNMAVTYRGDSIITWGEGSYGASMYFSAPGKLQRMLEPVTEPYILTEFNYTNGLITERKTYFKTGSNWVYQSRLVFGYQGNKIVSINEEQGGQNPVSTGKSIITWEGDNVASVTSGVGTTNACTVNFSYDATKSNTMKLYSYLYFSDGDANYNGYKLPYYFSKNLLIKQTSNDCRYQELNNYTYTFKSNGLVESMLNNGQVRWIYDYSCP